MSTITVSQIDHVELYVPDREVAAEWYERVLGLKQFGKAASWAENPRGPLMISPDAGRTMVALFTGPSQGNHEAVGLCRLAFRIDAQGFLEFVNGGVVKVEVKDHGMALSAYFTDPWGTPLEVTTYEAEIVRERRRTRDRSDSQTVRRSDGQTDRRTTVGQNQRARSRPIS